MQTSVPGPDFGYSVSITEQIGEREQTTTVMFGSRVDGEAFAAIKLVSKQKNPRVPHLPEVSEAMAIFSDQQSPETVQALHELSQAMKREGGKEWVRPPVEYGGDPTAGTPGYDSHTFSPNGYC